MFTVLGERKGRKDTEVVGTISTGTNSVSWRRIRRYKYLRQDRKNQDTKMEI